MDDTKFIEVCNESQSMSAAAVTIGVHFNTFKQRAQKLGCYKPNQSGKGTTKSKSKGIYPLTDILAGLHPQYQTFKLKNRLIKEGLKQNECECCGLGSEWNGKIIKHELDHIDGIRTNHKLENLRIICPNCHSQTDTFRAKNIK